MGTWPQAGRKFVMSPIVGLLRSLILDKAYIEVTDQDGAPIYLPQWYVLKTKPRAERHAASILESRQVHVYLPLLKRQRSFEPLFPGYLFLKIDCQTDEYLRSRSAPGVSYILNADGVPIPVPEDLVEAIRRRLGEENSLSPAERFRQGERVIVTSGPFRDIEAVFDRALTPHGRCQVFLQILGRITRVQLDAGKLAKLRH